MADLLIKGMEMPIEGEAVVLVLSKENGIMMAEVDEYCGAVYEAVPISPHARLIDADELKELFRETITGIATRTDMKGAYEHMIRASAMVIDMIDDAPTVIEASEDGEQDDGKGND